MVENEILIKQLKVLIDFGKVNELQGIVDVAENAITAINGLVADRDRLQKDFNELDAENLAMLRDFEILAEIHRPCELCSKKNCRERNEVTEMHCPVIEWRGVCEENCGGDNNEA